MSRAEKFKPVCAAEIGQDWTADDLKLQIDIRLRLDDAADEPVVRQDSRQSPTAAELSGLAGEIFDARRRRDKMLGADLFGEPAWDMILALYCLPARGETLGVTSLSYAANVPMATGHRVQAALRARGLIEQSPEPSDARRQLVSLTEKGRVLLERYLASLFCSNRLMWSHFGRQ